MILKLAQFLFLGMPDCLLESSAARKKYATSKVVFNQEVLDIISQTRSQIEDELDVRHEALLDVCKN